jgi:hypothetical protein
LYGANYLALNADGEEKFHGLTAPPANDKETKGHLRMARTGKMLSYQVEEGGTGYRTIATKEVGLADVIAVQALGATGWQPVAMEVRFPWLVLRASEMPDKEAGAVAPMPSETAVAAPNAPAQPQAIAPQTASEARPILLLVIGLGVVVSLAVVAGLVILLRKRDAAAMDGPGTPTKTAAPQFVVFPCPDCGKKLKVKAELAGKKVKCNQCGKAVLVADEHDA